MPRLGRRDRQRIAELSDALHTWDPTAQPIATLASALCDVLDAPRAAVYSIRHERNIVLEFAHVEGALCGNARAIGLVDEHLRRVQQSFGVFDLLSPEPRQRNTVVALPALPEMLASLEREPRGWTDRFAVRPADVYERLAGYGEVLRSTGFDARQLRVLVCDGPALLAWAGISQEEPFSARQRLLLAALVPALQERLRLDQHLRDADTASTALDATLGAIPVAAFVVKGRGQIRCANPAGRSLLARSGTASFREALRAGPNGPRTEPTLRWTRIAAPGLPAHYLVVAVAKSSIDPARVDTARRRWGLGRRQLDVLAWILRGATNKAIAAELGLVESTVEQHVTTLLERADVSTRSELVAAFWEGGT